MQAQLDTEVAEYNALIDQINNLRTQVAQAEEERLQRLGRIQMLSELAEQAPVEASDDD